MKTKLLAVLSLYALFSLGNDADAADPLTGAYLGANAGYGSGKSHSSGSAELNNKPSGALGGLQGGYNWRSRDYIAGLQVDVDAARMHDSIKCPNPALDCKTEIKGLGSLRANIGGLAGRYFLYGTAGLSSTRLKVSVDDQMGTGDSQTSKRTGWTAGLGLAMPLGDRLWWQAQYLHTDFGTKDQTIRGNSFRNKVTTDAVVLGLNFTF